MADVHYTGDKDEATSKATFETLLAKWDEIFQRDEFFGDDAEWGEADGIDRVSSAGGKTLEFGKKSVRKVKGDVSGMIGASGLGVFFSGMNENTLSFAYSSAGKTLELATTAISSDNNGFRIKFSSENSVEVAFSENGEKLCSAQSEFSALDDSVKEHLASFIGKLTEAKKNDADRKKKREADAKNAELEVHKAALYDALGDL